jgi:hypothetical protein
MMECWVKKDRQIAWFVFVGVLGLLVLPHTLWAAVADSWKAEWEQTLATAKQGLPVQFFEPVNSKKALSSARARAA